MEEVVDTIKNQRQFSTEEEKQIVEQFNSGMRKSRIMRMYDISQDQLVRIVRDAIRKNPLANYKKNIRIANQQKKVTAQKRKKKRKLKKISK